MYTFNYSTQETLAKLANQYTSAGIERTANTIEFDQVVELLNLNGTLITKIVRGSEYRNDRLIVNGEVVHLHNRVVENYDDNTATKVSCDLTPEIKIANLRGKSTIEFVRETRDTLIVNIFVKREDGKYDWVKFWDGLYD